MCYAPQYGIRRKWVRRAKNPFSLPCAIEAVAGRVGKVAAKHFATVKRSVVGRNVNVVRNPVTDRANVRQGVVRYSRRVPELQVLGHDVDPRRMKAALLPGVNVWHYGKAVARVMAKNTVRYHAPYGVRPFMYLWHATKWLGRFTPNPWHPDNAGVHAPTMSKPYKVGRMLAE